MRRGDKPDQDSGSPGVRVPMMRPRCRELSEGPMPMHPREEAVSVCPEEQRPRFPAQPEVDDFSVVSISCHLVLVWMAVNLMLEV